MSKFMISGDHDRKTTNNFLSPRQRTVFDGGVGRVPSAMNILNSMGQSVYIFNLDDRIVYWNRMSEILYGYSVEEALGKTVPEIIISSKYAELATLIIHRAGKGETWSGEFPVRNKTGERFTVITSLVPSRDAYGTINGVLCVCADVRPFIKPGPQSSVSFPLRNSSAKFGIDPQQFRQNAIVSKISNLASKVKSKIKTGENNMDDDFVPLDLTHDVSSTDEHLTENPAPDSNEKSENRREIHKVLSSKAETWMDKKGIAWPWERNENGGSFDGSTGRSWPWSLNSQEHELGSDLGSIDSLEVDIQMYESASNTTGDPNSLSSSCDTSSSGSTNNYGQKLDIIAIDHFDVEISWNDLIVREQIGQGSCGTVYRALWHGSDVAVKVFTEQKYPDDVLISFRKEVSLMKRLRHPNILLFMGAVTSPEHLCIITEFLPRGSLFRLLHQNTSKLDWRRSVHMAIDIAQGMSYLHHCHPPIVHRDLKSSNLLVDKNWTVKVGDFGLSRIKRETYLTTRNGNGTPQWMAPEVLRNEEADEKSDVYSYGVVLWEIATGKIPWDDLNPMQVIGAVGFMNRRLEIPNHVNPQWASLIESCWSSDPRSRPTFQEIQIKLKDLPRKFAVRCGDSRS